jgi:hypothetical protein
VLAWPIKVSSPVTDKRTRDAKELGPKASQPRARDPQFRNILVETQISAALFS